MRPNGQAIREIRRAKNIGLRALQKMTGLDRGYLSRMERGHIEKSDDEQVRKVATALNVALAAITHKEKT